jgi:hypothetical protein
MNNEIRHKLTFTNLKLIICAIKWNKVIICLLCFMCCDFTYFNERDFEIITITVEFVYSEVQGTLDLSSL